MGTRKSSRAPAKKAVRTPNAAAPKARLNAAELQQAVRTLAAMAACFEKPNPMIRPRKGGGTDRIVEAALADAVAAIAAARTAQAALATRAAEMLLLDTLSSAIVALRNEAHNDTDFRAPIARMGHAPAMIDNSPRSRLDAEVRRACDAYFMMTGTAVRGEAIDEVIAEITDQCAAERKGPMRGGNLAHEMVELLVDVSDYTLQKRRAERRQVPEEEHEKLRRSLRAHEERKKEDTDGPTEAVPIKFPFGDVGHYFGASHAPTCGDLAAMLGGPAFLANALAELGPEMAMRCAVYAYEANGLREMAMHRAFAQRPGGHATSAEFVAARTPLHEAAAAMAVALGGKSDAYEPQQWQDLSVSTGGATPAASAATVDLRLNAPAVYPGEWVVFQSVPGRWARAGGV